ncbi:MAG: aryl-sulfate sulfotransferase, partial [Halolamina sp.]
MNVRLGFRALMLAVALASVATVSGAFLAAENTATDPAAAFEEGERAVDPPGETTVITTSQYGNNFLVAFEPNGTVAYYDDRYAFYNEVEHVPGTESIIYVATEQLDRAECHATEPCNRNVIERVNLTTGERELLYERANPRDRNQWHTIALVDDRHIAVGDIAFDRVFVLDTETEMIEWEWEAQSDFDRSGGGIYPGDWTHLNDVEVLPDGRVMVSLRNQDQVVFIDPDDGLQRNWTLGADGDHSVLYEQHNPEYIPPAGGGPAVLVA